MSYSSIKAALIAQLTAHTTGLTSVTGAEPRNVEAPALYVLEQDFTRATSGQVTAMTYTFLARLTIPWIEPSAAEAAVDLYLNQVPAAVDLDPFLGRAITSGMAECSRGTFGYWKVGEITFRIVDFVITATEKDVWQSGI